MKRLSWIVLSLMLLFALSTATTAQNTNSSSASANANKTKPKRGPIFRPTADQVKHAQAIPRLYNTW